MSSTSLPMVHILVASSKSRNFAFLSQSGRPEIPSDILAYPVFEVEAHETIEALARARRKCARNEIDPRSICWPSQSTPRL